MLCLVMKFRLRQYSDSVGRSGKVDLRNEEELSVVAVQRSGRLSSIYVIRWF